MSSQKYALAAYMYTLKFNRLTGVTTIHVIYVKRSYAYVHCTIYEMQKRHVSTITCVLSLQFLLFRVYVCLCQSNFVEVNGENLDILEKILTFFQAQAHTTSRF